jgi:hypothetical protein
VNIESEANKDLALDSAQAENVVGGSGNKKAKTQRHVVTKSVTNRMIVEPALGPLGNEGVEAPVPVDPDTGYSL